METSEFSILGAGVGVSKGDTEEGKQEEGMLLTLRGRSNTGAVPSPFYRAQTPSSREPSHFLTAAQPAAFEPQSQPALNRPGAQDPSSLPETSRILPLLTPLKGTHVPQKHFFQQVFETQLCFLDSLGLVLLSF